ncbi:hypothetical protein GB931_17020 [Modestobacter sp. I12A-02628]|uniref:Uncharacterized protein n=1 Tax=Goekera deserti TaxID=2497753 RepID=A0A7K3WDV6_9ACTN|nr:hypothetical protein [Goekera deserti]MPQ99587.1 hypothetical protein [Goekera deserti]NDI46402.1 hypothetical protein [Goekera deserti]NEL54665.1 hypothetical protein [Goekera deserti]
MYKVLKSMPPRHRQFVLGALQLRKAATVNRGMAAQLLARLRGGDAATRVHLLRDVTAPISASFDAGADAAQWRAVLGDDDMTALDVYAANPALADSLALAVRDFSPALFDAGMAAAISVDTAAAAAALAALAVGHDAAREAYTTLRESHPALPPVPAWSLAELAPSARLAAIGQEDGYTGPEALADLLDDLSSGEIDDVLPDDEGTGAEALGAETEGLPAPLRAASAASPVAASGMLDDSDVLDAVGDFLDDWDAVAEDAAAIAAALADGRFADPDAVDRVAEHSAAGSVVLAALADELGRAVPPTRDDVFDAADGLRRRREAAADVSWLLRLQDVSGPDAMAGELAAVRAAALTAVSDPDAPRDALSALWQLVELAGEARRGAAVDFAALAAAQAAAVAAWPDAVALVSAVAVGAVTVPDEARITTADDPAAAGSETASETATEPSADLDTAPAAVGTSADAPQPTDQNTLGVVPAGDQPDAAPSSATDSGTGPDTDIPDVPDTADAPGHSERPADAEDTSGGPALPQSPAETEQPATAAEPTTSSAATDGSGRDQTVQVADLDELDELLNAGAGAALAAVSGQRRRATTPPPAAVEVPASTDSVDDRAQDTPPGTPEVGDVAALLASQRFGLAADVLEAAGAPAPSVAARRLAAYADALVSPTGRLATAFAELAPQLNRESLGDDRGGQLLALTAAARIALLAPSAGPVSVMLDLLPCVSAQSSLTEALTALADASRAGVVVLPEAADAVGTLAAAEHAAAEAAASAAELISGASRRVIKYIPANGVYQAWMSPSGELGELLAMVATNDINAVSAVRDGVVRLRGKANKAIDTTFAEQRRNHSNQIVAGARATLQTRWEAAVDQAATWAELAERAAERRAAIDAGAWQAGPLAKLRHRLAAVRDDALTELAATTGDAGVLAAVSAAGDLLSEAFAICDGEAPGGGEPSPAYAAHHELLASDLTLDAETLLPDGGLAGEHLAALLAVAEAGPADITDVYAHRAARGDHDLTSVLIGGVSATDPATGSALERRRSADIAAQSADVANDVAALVNLIDTRRMAGTLDDQPWAALAARAEALADAKRRDFGRIRAAMAAVTADLDKHVQAKIQATLHRIDERARDNTAVAEHADMLADLTRRGQVASAEEYLETVISGGQPPEAAAGTDHLARFFPQVPQAAAGRPQLLAALHAVLGGRVDDDVTAWLDEAGLDLSGLSEARRDAGRKALGAWTALAGRTSQRADLTSALRAVLAQAGLEFDTAKTERTGTGQTGRTWVRLTGVAGTGPALTPTLGSAMSPDGTTLRVLLVKNAPTPATLIEWMGVEPADHTVLALWLGGALSPADRRAIADAARGRPNPPLLVLDDAALAYLVCQGEPRRATFEATALPFTAASPYRDTPGDTPLEMFYGRTDELAAVVDLNGPSFVSGGRQLGKSALLRAAARRFEEGGEGRHAVLISVFNVGGDGRPERLWGKLWPHLADIGIVPGAPPASEDDLSEVVYTAVRQWLEGDAQRALLILLDEADAFLDADAAGNRFDHVDTCRRLMWDSGRRAKVVFAGLHRTARFESLPNQPLSHLGRPISVGPLRPQHAHDLLVEPLASLGFRFDDPIALPARILAMTNNMPALLQLFGQALVAHLSALPVPADGPPQVITDADVDEVFYDAELNAAFREKYVLTLNLDHRYLVIAYAVAAVAHEHGVDTSLSLVELSETARLHWPEGFSGVGADVFRGLVAECVDLGVLAADSGRYRLRTPTVLRLLGTDEEVLETLYTASERLAVPSAADGGSYRRRVGHGRSPLTEAQLGRLFDARRQVLTVTGSGALGVDAVWSAIEAARADEAHRVAALVRVRTTTPDGVRTAVGLAAADSTLMLVDAQAHSPAALTELVQVAEKAVADAARDVTVAVLASPANAAAWAADVDRVDLLRVDEPGLRMWCDEDGLPFRDDESRALLLAASGGWPRVLAHLTQMAGKAGPATGAGKLLADLDTWLSGGGGKQLVASAGLGPETPVLTAAFRSAVNLCSADGEDRQMLAELLELDGLSAAAADAGFGPLVNVVDALEALGCLAPTAGGRVRPEPVLAQQLPAAGGAA